MMLDAGPPTVAELVHDHYPCVYRVAYRMCGRSADAEDLTQQTFLQAQQYLAQLRNSESVLSWLIAILRNCYRKTLRGRKHLTNVDDLEPSCVPPRPDTVDGEQLQQALNELPEPFRTPVILFYFQEFSYQEIARVLRVPIGTVMSRLARGKARLRARLSASAKSRAEAGYGL